MTRTRGLNDVTLHNFVVLTFFEVSLFQHRELTYLTRFLLFEAIALQIEFSNTVSCCFVCFDFELHFFCLVTMAKRPKRKYISKNNQEQLLQTFCDNLGNHENTFLGHKFKHKDGSIVESGTNLE